MSDPFVRYLRTVDRTISASDELTYRIGLIRQEEQFNIKEINSVVSSIDTIVDECERLKSMVKANWCHGFPALKERAYESLTRLESLESSLVGEKRKFMKILGDTYVKRIN